MVDRREMMRKKINSLKVPSEMKRTAWKFYIRGYGDALQEKSE